jgi:hypothetical protein
MMDYLKISSLNFINLLTSLNSTLLISGMNTDSLMIWSLTWSNHPEVSSGHVKITTEMYKVMYSLKVMVLLDL